MRLSPAGRSKTDATCPTPTPRAARRARRCSGRTEQTYCHWVKRFIFSHNVRHLGEMAEPAIDALQIYLAANGTVSAWTKNQAFSAMLFPYRFVTGREVSGLLRRFA